MKKTPHYHDTRFADDVKPKSLTSLIDLNEGVYMRLRKLIPNLGSIEKDAVSHVYGYMSLHLSIVERSQYTTSFILTYHFNADSSVKTRQQLEPNLLIRMYHDAHLAEAVSAHMSASQLMKHGMPAKTRIAKWQLNRFLFKWLGYSLRQGHSFAERTAPFYGKY